MILLFFIILTLVVTSYAIYKMVRLGTDLLFPDSTQEPLTETKAVDEIIKKGKPLDKGLSISDQYNLVLENPLDYTEEQRQQAKDKYHDLLEGKIPDPDAKHLPPERDGDYVNRHYITYLEKQSKLLGKDSWHNAELKRIRKVVRKEVDAVDFRLKLMEFGAQTIFVHAMDTPYRVEKYKPVDWITLIETTNKYLKSQKASYIQYFLENVQELEIITDEDKFELFCELLEHDVPEQVAAIIIKAPFDDEDIASILALVHENADYDEAIKQVVYQKKQDLQTILARREMES